MSRIVLSQDGLTISTYAGSNQLTETTNSKSRTCVQIDSGYDYATLNMDQWIDIVCFVRRMDEQGIGIINTKEVDV